MSESLLLLKQSLEALRDQPDRLIEIILRQAGVIAEQQKKIQELEKQIQDLNDKNNGLSVRLEQLEKAAARQAAPFRIKENKRKIDSQKTRPQKRSSRQLPPCS